MPTFNIVLDLKDPETGRTQRYTHTGEYKDASEAHFATPVSGTLSVTLVSLVPVGVPVGVPKLVPLPRVGEWVKHTRSPIIAQVNAVRQSDRGIQLDINGELVWLLANEWTVVAAPDLTIPAIPSQRHA